MECLIGTDSERLIVVPSPRGTKRWQSTRTDSEYKFGVRCGIHVSDRMKTWVILYLGRSHQSGERASDVDTKPCMR